MSVNRQLTDRKSPNLKKVEPFIPIEVPKRSKNSYKVETVTTG